MGQVSWLTVLPLLPLCPAGNSFDIYRDPKDKFTSTKWKFPDMKTGNIYLGKDLMINHGG